MEDTSGSSKRGVLVVLTIVTLLVILIILSGAPATFLNWFLSILTAFSLLLVFAFVFALVCVVIAAVLHRYAERRRQETEHTDQEQFHQRLPPHIRRAQYIPRQEQSDQPNDYEEDNDS